MKAAEPTLGYNPDEDEDGGDVLDSTEDGADDPSWASLSRHTRESLGNWLASVRGGTTGLDADLVKNLVATLVAGHDPADPDGDGAILVFLTGWDEITKVNDLMRADRSVGDRTRCVVLPLHGAMPTANQREIFDRPAHGRSQDHPLHQHRRDVHHDRRRHARRRLRQEQGEDVRRFEHLACLQPAWISKASAHQRRGRAGRVREGVCYRLYTRAQHAKMADHATPELLRTPLEELCLTIKSLGLGLCEPFIARALQPPEPKSVHNAIELLITIGALSRRTEELTPLGRHLAALPVDPRVGKMLVTAATFGCLSPALTIAAGMAYKDPFVLPMDRSTRRTPFLQASRGTRAAITSPSSARSRGGRARAGTAATGRDGSTAAVTFSAGTPWSSCPTCVGSSPTSCTGSDSSPTARDPRITPTLPTTGTPRTSPCSAR